MKEGILRRHFDKINFRKEDRHYAAISISIEVPSNPPIRQEFA